MKKVFEKIPTAWLVGLALAAVTMAAFAPVAQNGFINYDDPDYVTKNPHVQAGLTWSGARWAFGSFYSSNWHPLTWISHMTDCQLFGLNPAAHHLMNLFLHVVNTLLLFHLLRKYFGGLWPSALVALLFGIHPMHVESVAWVSERKDMLSAFFLLLTLLCYARFAQGVKRGYLLALLFFALGLMSKPMLVTLPLILLLLDFWPLKRFTIDDSRLTAWRLFTEKIPFFALALASGVVTILAQARGKSVVPVAVVPPLARLAHAPVAAAWYLQKLFWPMRLSIFYPLPQSDPLWLVILSVSVIAGLTWFALAGLRRRPQFFVGWLWFLAMLLPVSGLLQVGGQAYADRYSYLPYIGLSVALAWGVPEILAWWRGRDFFLGLATTIMFTAFFILTSAEVRFWKNTKTLFARAVLLDEKNDVAWLNLGIDAMTRGEWDAAVALLRRATADNPPVAEFWNKLGSALAMKTDFAGAESAFNTALQLSPDDADVHYHLGGLMMDTRRFDEAIAKLQTALRLQPGDADIEMSLATAFDVTGRSAEAIAHYRNVLRAKPNSADALNNLAWLLATSNDDHLRDGNEAVRLASRACELTENKQAMMFGTLAAAYAETGNFSGAVSKAQRAREMALEAGQKEIAAKNEELLALYQSGRAYHEAARTNSVAPP